MDTSLLLFPLSLFYSSSCWVVCVHAAAFSPAACCQSNCCSRFLPATSSFVLLRLVRSQDGECKNQYHKNRHGKKKGLAGASALPSFPPIPPSLPGGAPLRDSIFFSFFRGELHYCCLCMNISHTHAHTCQGGGGGGREGGRRRGGGKSRRRRRRAKKLKATTSTRAFHSLPPSFPPSLPPSPGKNNRKDLKACLVCALPLSVLPSLPPSLPPCACYYSWLLFSLFACLLTAAAAAAVAAAVAAAAAAAALRLSLLPCLFLP